MFFSWEMPKFQISDIFIPCSCHHISASVAPFRVCNMSNCSPRRVHHSIPLHHIHLSSYWCMNHHCKSASWCFLLSVIKTSSFVIFAMIDVCILWGWCLHVFWTMLCLLYSGVCHAFLWSMWWLAQACKQGIVMLLILVPVLLLFWCHVNLMLQRDPCIFWDTSVRVFCTYGYFISIHALGCNYGVV